ncbi:MAG TPA: DUF58 domain-containing protein [Bryobacteraceae bacterium]|nr:DUF58 domain-containing protein [Bryobacteraceae bacterium]
MVKFSSLRRLVGRRVRYRITRGGVLFFTAVILTGVAAFLTADNLLFLVFSAMLALLLISGFLSRLVLSGLELELLLPEHVSARAPMPARVRLRNLKRITPSFSIELSALADPVNNAPPILTSPIYFPLLTGGSESEANVDVTFPFRGRHRENLFVLSTRFPFGFLHKRTNVPLRRETIVYPRLEPTAEAEQLANNVLGELGDPVQGMGREFHRIRPYEPRDSARHVDWKATAHTGELQVREFAKETQRTVEVYLDRRISAGQQSWFENAIEQCAFLVWRLSQDQIELLLRSQRFSLAIPQQSDVYAALRFLALAEPLMTGGAEPEAPVDSANLQVVYSVNPDDFEAADWDMGHSLRVDNP